MEVDDSYKIPWCFEFNKTATVTVFYKSEQVLRFRVKHLEKELQVEKRLLIKSRQPWKLLKSNFVFTGEKDGRNLTILLHTIDEIIKPKAHYEYPGKK